MRDFSPTPPPFESVFCSTEEEDHFLPFFPSRFSSFPFPVKTNSRFPFCAFRYFSRFARTLLAGRSSDFFGPTDSRFLLSADKLTALAPVVVETPFSGLPERLARPLFLRFFLAGSFYHAGIPSSFSSPVLSVLRRHRPWTCEQEPQKTSLLFRGLPPPRSYILVFRWSTRCWQLRTFIFPYVRHRSDSLKIFSGHDSVLGILVFSCGSF